MNIRQKLNSLQLKELESKVESQGLTKRDTLVAQGNLSLTAEKELLSHIPNEAKSQVPLKEPESKTKSPGLTKWDTLIAQRNLALTAEREFLSHLPNEAKSHVPLDEVKRLGQHMLAEFNASDSFKEQYQKSSDKAKFIHNILLAAVKKSGAGIIAENGFVTINKEIVIAIVPVEQSHFIMIFDGKIACVDGFTCGDMPFQGVIDDIAKAIGGEPYDQIILARGNLNPKTDLFYPGIAALEPARARLNFFSSKIKLPDNIKSMSKHYVVELNLCDQYHLNNPNLINDAFDEAFEKVGATPVYHGERVFDPQGVTSIHVARGKNPGEFVIGTIHDWPQHGHGPIDLHVRGESINGSLILNHVAARLDSKQINVVKFPRENYDILTKEPAVVFKKLEKELADDYKKVEEEPRRNKPR